MQRTYPEFVHSVTRMGTLALSQDAGSGAKPSVVYISKHQLRRNCHSYWVAETYPNALKLSASQFLFSHSHLCLSPNKSWKNQHAGPMRQFVGGLVLLVTIGTADMYHVPHHEYQVLHYTCISARFSQQPLRQMDSPCIVYMHHCI